MLSQWSSDIQPASPRVADAREQVNAAPANNTLLLWRLGHIEHVWEN
jgi:hypothetical protein